VWMLVGASAVQSQASVSHPSCLVISVNGHRQSGGHWNAALGLGTSIGLPGFSVGGWGSVGGRGALSGSGVRGVNGSLLSCVNTVQKEDSAAVALRHQRNKRLGRIVPPHFCSLEINLQRSHLWELFTIAQFLH
jgi:hypothetical protein